MEGDLDPAAQARRIATELLEQAAAVRTALAAASAVSYTAGAASGGQAEVTAVADGTGRVTRVEIGPAALREGPERLGTTLVDVLNRALRGAAERASETLRRTAGPAIGPALGQAEGGAAQADPDLVARLAAEEGTGRSPGREVTVVAAGSGTVKAVHLSAGATRGGDGALLGEQVTRAVTAALEEARRPQRELAATLGRDDAYGQERLAAMVATYTQRMNGVLAELEQRERQIAGLES